MPCSVRPPPDRQSLKVVPVLLLNKTGTMEGRAIPTSTSPLLRFRESYGYVAGFRTRSNLVYRLTSAAALNSPAGALAKTRDPQQESSQKHNTWLI